MRIGLYSLPVRASVGGGFVLRDDVARLAESFQGRHQFETVTPPRHVRALSWLNRKWPRPGTSPSSRWLRAEAARRNLDLIWFNHFEPVDSGLPYALNIFDLQHRLQPWFPEVGAGGQWEHREKLWANAIRRAAIVTVGSEEAREQLCHFYRVPLDTVKVLRFPTPQKAIDIALGRVHAPPLQDIRAKYGIKNRFLFYPAQFWPHKNHVNLLRALQLLQQRGRAVSLVLTGSDHGNLRHVQTAAREIGVAELVHFCGFVPYADILTFYREALALAYVSFFGPENLPPLEAMALECPVILSDIPGIRALHGEGPVSVNPKSPESIADAVEYVLDHPEQIQERVRAAKALALANDCEKYLHAFQGFLDAFEPVRRCWA